MKSTNIKLFLVFLLIINFGFSQENYSVFKLDSTLTANSNAVIRKNEVKIEISSIDKISVKKHRVVTVLNKLGESSINALEFYDNSIKIKKIEAKIYNALGQEIKKFKKNDFLDVSVADGFSIFNDNRAKHVNYTAVSYPYTVEFTSESIRTNTAFIPKWYPIEGYYTSTEFSSFEIVNSSDIKLSSKATNFENYSIVKNDSLSRYQATHIPAIVYEAYSPALMSLVPELKFALKKFSMEGVEGENTNWQNFGKWMDEKLLKETDVLSDATVSEIKAITKEAKSKEEKAKIIYKYVQEKSRYVSIQVGIGGWKPMLAQDVHRLGYGDCKGLTNYTKALLKAVDVESYYAVVYGDSEIKNLDKNFSSLEGNHVILNIPDKQNSIWLECTSQTNPFGYIADFTDDRDVLIITPDGGKIVHTNTYSQLDNIEDQISKINLDVNGNISVTTSKSYQGTRYNNHSGIIKETKKNQEQFFKNYYNNINNLKIESLKFINNTDDIVFTEYLDFTAPKVAFKANRNLIIAPNVLGREVTIPQRYNQRKLPFEIDRGFVIKTENQISLPENYSTENLPLTFNIQNKFGHYKVQAYTDAPSTIIYKRELVINNGKFHKDDYNEFREFWIQIANHDNTKIEIKAPNNE